MDYNGEKKHTMARDGPGPGEAMGWIKKRLQGFLQYKDLLLQLVGRDVKLKYRRSFLGYLWSVLNPLMIMCVMTIVFSYFFRNNIPNFPVYLLIGQVLFSFMTESTTGAIVSITGNGALLKKTYVPKYIFTLSKVTSSLVNLLFSTAALWIVMIVTGVKLTPYFFFFPVVYLELYVFCIGLGLFLAQASVFFRDIQYIYGVIITAWTYFTPIFYPDTILPEGMRWYILHINPMYYYIAQFRDLVLTGAMPGPDLMLGAAVIPVLMLVIGVWSFHRNQDRFILFI